MTQAELAKDTAVIPIGGCEFEQKKKVQLLFKKRKDPFKGLKQSDCDYLDMMHDFAEALKLF